MRVFSLLKRYGIRGFAIKAEEKLKTQVAKDYSANYESFKAGSDELLAQRNTVFDYSPLISIVVPAYNTNEAMFKRLMDSVEAQTYENWQLCIADASTEPVVASIAEYYQKNNRERIVYKRLKKNSGISDNTNEGFAMAEGEYIALLDHDDELSPDALFYVVKAINDSIKEKGIRPVMLYSDEDKVNEDSSRHFAPHFKQDFNRELLNRYNYVCHFLVFSKSVLDTVGGLDKAYDGSQDHDFILRITEHFDDKYFVHIKKVLYHWRVHSGSTAKASENKNYAYNAGLRAVAEHFNRVGMKDVTSCEVPGYEYYGVKRNHRIKDEDVFAFIGEGIKADSEWKNILAQYLGDTDREIALAGGKLIKNGRVLSCGFVLENDELVPMCEGIKSYWKGYSWLAAVSRDVDMVSTDFFVGRADVLKKCDIIDEDGRLITKDPNEIAKRVKALGYRIVVDGTVVGRY